MVGSLPSMLGRKPWIGSPASHKLKVVYVFVVLALGSRSRKLEDATLKTQVSLEDMKLCLKTTTTTKMAGKVGQCVN